MELNTPQGLSTVKPANIGKKSLLISILIGSVAGIGLGAAGYFFILSPRLVNSSAQLENTNVGNNANTALAATNTAQTGNNDVPSEITGNLHLLALTSNDIPESWDTFYCCAGTEAGYVNLPGAQSRFQDENIRQKYILNVTGLEEGQSINQEITEYTTVVSAKNDYDQGLTLYNALAKDFLNDNSATTKTEVEENSITTLKVPHFLALTPDDDTALHYQTVDVYALVKNSVVSYGFQLAPKISKAEIMKVAERLGEKLSKYTSGTNETLLAQQAIVDRNVRDGIRINGSQHAYVSLLAYGKTKSGSAPYPSADGNINRDPAQCPTRTNCQAGILTGGLTQLTSDQLMPPAGTPEQETVIYDTFEGKKYLLTIQLEGYDKNWIFFNDAGDVGWTPTKPTCSSETTCPE